MAAADKAKNKSPLRSTTKSGRPEVSINNRRARYDYHIGQTYECGIMLLGSEVKAIRDGRATLGDSYARVDGSAVWLLGMHISPYSYSREELDPVRPRKLLLHAKEIDALARAAAEKGVTLVPLRLTFVRGRAKIDLAVARGKRAYDKRHAIKEREAKRDTDRALKGHRD